jgi:outer membrane lipoprotein-sorting protein
MPASTRRVSLHALRRSAVACALALGGAFASGTAFAFDLAQLAAQLARVPAGEATFVEKRRVEMLDRTIESAGKLSFKAPDTFVRETTSPRREVLTVTGNTLSMTVAGRARTMQLDALPEAAVVVEAIRGVLTGNRATLERVFAATVGGDPKRWTLDLVPRDARLRGQVASIRVAGGGAVVREVQILLADGDRSTMSIEPLVPTPAR